jgi:Trk-type K+ transport system membrane component
VGTPAALHPRRFLMLRSQLNFIGAIKIITLRLLLMDFCGDFITSELRPSRVWVCLAGKYQQLQLRVP